MNQTTNSNSRKANVLFANHYLVSFTRHLFKILKDEDEGHLTMSSYAFYINKQSLNDWSFLALIFIFAFARHKFDASRKTYKPDDTTDPIPSGFVKSLRAPN